MKKRREIEEQLKETKMALKILRETIELNDPPGIEAWMAAFHIMIAAAFAKLDMTYEQYCKHMEQAKTESKHMWE